MSEVKGNIRPGLGEGWSKVGGMWEVWDGHWLRDDGGRVESGNLNKRRF